MATRRIAFLLVPAISIAFPSFAQTPGATRPAFEVASIKLHADSDGSSVFGFQNIPGSSRMDMMGVTFRMLMTYAYGVRDFQIIGGPVWITSERYDIHAKAEDGSIPALTGMRDLSVPDPMALRIRSLLDDRFQLMMHRETREVPIYELRGGTGRQLGGREAMYRTEPDGGPDAKELAAAKAGSKLKLSSNQGPPEPFQPGAPAPERGSLVIQRISSGWTLQGTGIPLSSLISALSGQIGLPIVDKSELKAGLYDVQLQWAPEPRAGVLPGFGRQTGTGDDPARTVEPNGPSIFTAIQEQLGLRLVPSKGPVEVFVIDDVQKPSAN